MTLTEDVIREALREVEDPEFPISVVDLGLIRGIEIDGSTVLIDLTYTSIACPARVQIMEDVENRLLKLTGVEKVEITEVFKPWSRKNITPGGRKALSLVAVI